MRHVVACLGLLLSACAGMWPQGAPRVYAQALDSETNACIRFPASCPDGVGGNAAGMAARQRAVEATANAASAAATLGLFTKEQQARIDEAILDCVKDADFQINDRLFGGSPTLEQCSEVLEKDSRGNPVTRAMRLGQEKHKLAMECIEQKLQQLRLGGFSLNQRYREIPKTEKWIPLSRKEVEALLREGGKELIGSIEPDIVIHAGNPSEVLDLYDLKFPCPGTNPARWNRYPEGHPYSQLNQGELYEKAFGAKPARVSPRWGVERPGAPQ